MRWLQFTSISGVSNLVSSVDCYYYYVEGSMEGLAEESLVYRIFAEALLEEAVARDSFPTG
jgi:hypothetical protein